MTQKEFSKLISEIQIDTEGRVGPERMAKLTKFAEEFYEGVPRTDFIVRSVEKFLIQHTSESDQLYYARKHAEEVLIKRHKYIEEEKAKGMACKDCKQCEYTINKMRYFCIDKKAKNDYNVFTISQNGHLTEYDLKDKICVYFDLQSEKVLEDKNSSIIL